MLLLTCYHCINYKKSSTTGAKPGGATVGRSFIRVTARTFSLLQNLLIASNFANFPQATTFLDKRGKTLVNNLQVFNKVTEDIRKVPGDVRKGLQGKCESDFSKQDLEEIKNIAKVLKGSCIAQDITMNIESVACFGYAQVTSAEVERGFSQLKHILSDRRHSLTPDNLNKMLVIMCHQATMVI